MKYILFSIFNLFHLFIFSQAYHTQPISSEIYTLQVSRDGDWRQIPVIKLSDNNYINISFDRLSDDSFNRLRYRLVHCDAYWKESRELTESDYLDGFNDNLIDDYSASRNTTVEYTHFNIEIPNQDVKLKLSGNYVVEVYEDGWPDNVLLTACFSILDPQVSISAAISSNTDIDTNQAHQQLSFTILHQNISIRDAQKDLKVFVWQNNRLDTERKDLKPTYINPGKLIYEHNLNLIFEAGNEYRRFETSSYRYNGLNVDRIEYNRPTYKMYIIPNENRSGRTYSYDQDQNGKFIIRSNESDNAETEADYFNTEFALSMDKPIKEDIFINGDFSYNNFTNKYRMIYDKEKQEYRLSLLLKQGLYNYLYLVKSGNNYSTGKIEGNFHETENEYQIFIYHRPPGQRYDSLIGIQNIASRNK